ncbi:hypothetical protein EJB05_08783, partial [Eragrostis curvula]
MRAHGVSRGDLADDRGRRSAPSSARDGAECAVEDDGNPRGKSSDLRVMMNLGDTGVVFRIERKKKSLSNRLLASLEDPEQFLACVKIVCCHVIYRIFKFEWYCSLLSDVDSSNNFQSSTILSYEIYGHV